jgi:hypothetical protein
MSELTTKEITTAELSEKRKASWVAFSETLTKTETELQLLSSKALNKLQGAIPKTIEEVPNAETVLIEVKKEFKIIENKRKELTSNLDRVTTRLMISEKQGDPAFKEITEAIIALKKQYEKIEAEKTAKANEFKNLRERLNVARISAIDGFNKKIVEKIQAIYENAFQQNVSMNTLEAYLILESKSFTEIDFVIQKPAKLPPTNYVTIDELQSLVDEILVCNPVDFLENFKLQLSYKFLDYEAALLNKEAALKQSKIETEQKNQEIVNETANATVASKLEIASNVLFPEPTLAIKGLKKVFKIEMTETKQNNLLIWKAYIGNYDLVDAKLSVKNSFNLSANNLIKALEAVKNNDPKFNPEGITFVETDKN